VKLTPREIVFIVLLIVLPASMYFLVVKKRSQAEGQMDTQNEQNLQALQQLDGARGLADMALQQQTDSLREARATGLSIPAQQTGQIVAQLEALAEKAGLPNPPDFKPINDPNVIPDPTTPYTERRYELKLSADFLSYYTFQKGLEALPLMVLYDRIEMNKPRDKKNGHFREGQVDVTMNIRIFFPKEEG
jgi:Tfp pilus assembly protein PilO